MLKNIDSLQVVQQKEWAESFTGFETRNRYTINDSKGVNLGLASEHSGSLILRLILKSKRAFKMTIMDNKNEVLLELHRPFTFILSEMEVRDKNGQLAGTIQQKFRLLEKALEVFDYNGNLLFQLKGPFWRPWTFKILENQIEVGLITKKWSGFFKEAITTADNFGAQFPVEWDFIKKAMALPAIFLIDFVYFEKNN